MKVILNEFRENNGDCPLSDGEKNFILFSSDPVNVVVIRVPISLPQVRQSLFYITAFPCELHASFEVRRSRCNAMIFFLFFFFFPPSFTAQVTGDGAVGIYRTKWLALRCSSAINLLDIFIMDLMSKGFPLGTFGGRVAG